MILVDTSVWVDYLRGRATPQVRSLKSLLSGDEIVGIAPIILQEILQGADSAERFETWRKYLPASSATYPETRWSRTLPLPGFISNAAKRARHREAVTIA